MFIPVERLEPGQGAEGSEEPGLGLSPIKGEKKVNKGDVAQGRERGARNGGSVETKHGEEKTKKKKKTAAEHREKE